VTLFFILSCALPPATGPSEGTQDTGAAVSNQGAIRPPSTQAITPRVGLYSGSATQIDGAPVEQDTDLKQTVLWGDPHAHSGLSADSCEDPEFDCAAEVAGAPGQNMAMRAAGNGLDWFAVTDHVDFEEYVDKVSGVRVPLWSGMLALAERSKQDEGVVLYAGYEWRDCSAGGSHHRTLIFESENACSTLRPPACSNSTSPKTNFGLEGYTRREDVGHMTAQELAEFLADESEKAGCETRWVGFAHHSAYTRPGEMDWEQSTYRMENEILLEIFSEHGSSECIDLTQPGCDFYASEDFYAPQGSAQAALQAGLLVGFVAGTDSHDSNPGSTADGPGPVTKIFFDEGTTVPEVGYHSAPGGVTAVLLPPGQVPDKQAVFDGLLARHTVASTVVVDGLELWIVDPLGRIYLPGDLVPTGTYRLHSTLPSHGDIVLVDQDGEVETVDLWFTVQRSRTRYLRIDLIIDNNQERLWASPFFPL
jgi:hypothetical protein